MYYIVAKCINCILVSLHEEEIQPEIQVRHTLFKRLSIQRIDFLYGKATYISGLGRDDDRLNN